MHKQFFSPSPHSSCMHTKMCTTHNINHLLYHGNFLLSEINILHRHQANMKCVYIGQAVWMDKAAQCSSTWRKLSDSILIFFFFEEFFKAFAHDFRFTQFYCFHVPNTRSHSSNIIRQKIEIFERGNLSRFTPSKQSHILHNINRLVLL